MLVPWLPVGKATREGIQMAHYNSRVGTCAICGEIVTADEEHADMYMPTEPWMTADERMVAAEKAGLAHIACGHEKGWVSL